jgi:hypothetical protein
MKFIIILVFSLSILSAQPCTNEAELLKAKKIDLDTKTMKSWVRLLKNRSKQNEYGVKLSQEEVASLIKCLMIEIEIKSKQGKMK